MEKFGSIHEHGTLQTCNSSARLPSAFLTPTFASVSLTSVLLLVRFASLIWCNRRSRTNQVNQRDQTNQSKLGPPEEPAAEEQARRARLH